MRTNGFFFERHLSQGHWGNVPEHLARWYRYNHEQSSRQERQELRAEAAHTLRQIINERLTERQRDAMNMFFFEGHSQVEIAEMLGVSQPTVNQHLAGKIRNGRRIGGGIQKLRKIFRRALACKGNDRTRLAAILVELIPTGKRQSTVPDQAARHRR